MVDTAIDAMLDDAMLDEPPFRSEKFCPKNGMYSRYSRFAADSDSD